MILNVLTFFHAAQTERTSLKDKFFLFEMNSNFNDVADKVGNDSSQREDLQPVQSPATNDRIKQSNVKKLRMSVEDKISSDKNSPLRKGLDKSDLCRNSNFGGGEKSESVKNLIEQVQNTLKSIENEPSSTNFNYSEVFSSPIHSNWRNSIFEFDNSGTEFLRHCPERASTGKIKNSNYIFPSHSKSSAKSATTLENVKEPEKQLIAEEKNNSTKVLLLGSEKNLNEAHKKAFKAAGGKIFNKKDSKSAHSSKECINKSNSNLRIRIAKSPVVTDSSNEYETDTGIPKSPTLFISGVSISRTPEPCASASNKEKKSPEHKSTKFSPVSKNLTCSQNKNNSSPILNLIPASKELESERRMNFSGVEENLFFAEQVSDKFLNCSRQNRSSSLTVPKPDVQKDSIKKNLNVSCGAILSCNIEKKLPNRKGSCQILSSSPRNSIAAFRQNNKDGIKDDPSDRECIFNFSGFANKESGGAHDQVKKSLVFFKSPTQNSGLPECTESNENYRSVSVDGNLSEAVKSGKSKSASEPEREREMFRFPKSSTDGALSSVLHVQESNLSSDDFHEVLFLLERSPKHGSKRKKKSKKERDKVKENCSKDKCIEDSSAL